MAKLKTFKDNHIAYVGLKSAYFGGQDNSLITAKQNPIVTSIQDSVKVIRLQVRALSHPLTRPYTPNNFNATQATHLFELGYCQCST